jgi:hypothetical protein
LATKARATTDTLRRKPRISATELMNPTESMEATEKVMAVTSDTTRKESVIALPIDLRGAAGRRFSRAG